MLAWLTSWVRVVPCIPQKGHHARAGAARPTQINRAISGRRILIRRPVIGGSPCASEAAWGRAGGWAGALSEPCRIMSPRRGPEQAVPRGSHGENRVVVLHNTTEPTPPPHPLSASGRGWGGGVRSPLNRRRGSRDGR